ncbi:MAG: glycosyltransferase family 4 protein [Minisyncoccia bacterium]
MKILFGITKANFGGAQRYVFDLATEAKRRGHEVAVLAGEGLGLSERLEKENIRIIKIPGLERDISWTKEIKTFFELTKVLRRERPDVFHINSSKMGGLGGLAARLVGIKKIIFTTHGWAFNEPRPEWQKMFIRFLAWLTILLSHKTICVSEKTKNDVADLLFVENKLTLIYNGIREFPMSQRHTDTFTIGTIAELHKIKGLDILLAAWGKFVKNRKATLVIMGEGEERLNLENMAKNMNTSDSVIFKGFVENARSFLKDFDIFCLSSRSEAMPYSLLEVGFAGLPVIATEVGGIPEVIENGLDGILVRPEDSEALFSSLLLLSGDKNLRQRLGEGLKKKIKEKFSFERMAEETFKLYSSR